MKLICVLGLVAVTLTGCTVAKTAGNVAVSTGQVALGVVDLAI